MAGTEFGGKSTWLSIAIALLFQFVLPTGLLAQRSEEHDDYKLKLDGFWFYSSPSGTFHRQSDTVPVVTPEREQKVLFSTPIEKDVRQVIRIVRLRKQAASEGLDPNRWFGNVELMAAKETGQEMVQYISNVYKYYVAYKLTLQEAEMRP